jgi:hypothetical protein
MLLGQDQIQGEKGSNNTLALGFSFADSGFCNFAF